jgi:hypothetical protein
MRRERNAVLDMLRTTGPAVPLAVLRAQFPRMGCAELQRLLRRYRRECRRQRQARPRRLYWSCAGSVWATDFVEHVGGLNWVLSVRDLASRRQLLWRSVASPSAALVTAALTELFREHGPPLVLKSDNGAAFIASETVELLRRQGVIPLFSPPRRPQYNGGCERGGAILKGYTYQHAVCGNRAGLCRASDLEPARQLANRLTRPWGHRGPSPDDVWQARPLLSAGQREEFCLELARFRRVACQQLEYPLDGPLTRGEAARRDRRAVQAALEALGYLTIMTRRDPQLRRPPTGQRPAPAGPAPQSAAENPAPAPAPTETPCTITTGGADVSEPLDAPTAVTPAHGEPVLSRVLRRSITPLLQILKAAKIT